MKVNDLKTVLNTLPDDMRVVGDIGVRLDKYFSGSYGSRGIKRIFTNSDCDDPINKQQLNIQFEDIDITDNFSKKIITDWIEFPNVKPKKSGFYLVTYNDDFVTVFRWKVKTVAWYNLNEIRMRDSAIKAWAYLPEAYKRNEEV